MNKPDESAVEMFRRTIHVEPTLAETLAAGGLGSLEEVAYIPLSEFLAISGLGEPDAVKLREIARLYLFNV